MAKQTTVPGSFVRRFWWIPVALVIIVSGVAFGRPVLDYLMGQLTPNPPAPDPVALANHPTPFTVEHVCFDTIPLYPASLASQAAHGLADTIDSSIQPGFGGLQLYSSYITGHSFQNDTGVSFTLPAVADYPLPPSKPVYGSSTFKNNQRKSTYQKDVAAWQKTIAQLKQQLAITQQAVHTQTNRLRVLDFTKLYNNKASDVFGCLADASSHFKNVPASVPKQLIIASDMVNNVSTQELGSINLVGVAITVVFYRCSDTALACQARTSYWANLVRRAGAKIFTVFDQAQSNPFPVAI